MENSKNKGKKKVSRSTRKTNSSRTNEIGTNSSNHTKSTKNTGTSGSKSRSASRKGSKKSKGKSFGRAVSISIKSIILLFLLTVIVGMLYFYKEYGKTIISMQSKAREVVRESTKDTFRAMETSLVYDVNGKLISTLKGEKDVYYLEYKDIPVKAVEAIVATEDKKFMQHDGVDYIANVRAAIALIQNRGKITQGASTITQQLARNIFLSHEVSYERKIKEIFIAQEIEKKYSKPDIMEFYFNNIYFGNGYYGIMAAANGYFQEGVKGLSLSQIVFLCSIPNNPTVYNPVTNMKNTMIRRDRILKIMLEDGQITSEEYQEAIKEKIVLKKSDAEKKNYVETYVYYSAIRSLMEEQGFEFRKEFTSKEDKEAYDEEYQDLYQRVQKSLYTSGYRIYTSIDLEMQEKLQKAVDEELKGFTSKAENGIYELQGAAVTIDNDTGNVVAIVGGRSQEVDGYTLNRAYQSYRQPGSAIKPLIVYGPAFERGYYPETIVVDEKLKDGPKNANKRYIGEMTLQSAIEQSTNTIAWKLFTELTPKVGIGYIERMGFQKIDNNDYYPAASLGGFTHGTSPVEMASAYGTLANDGVFRAPSCIISISDAEGRVLVQRVPEGVRIYESNTAKMMTETLSGVIKRGTAKGLGLKHTISAGKTGTTDDKKDGWFVGYTPYYTTSVWVGYDMPKTLNDLKGASYPGRIWHTFMNAIHDESMTKTFEYYDWKSILEEQKRLEEEEQKELELEDEMDIDPLDDLDSMDEEVPIDEEVSDDDIEDDIEDDIVDENQEDDSDTEEDQEKLDESDMDDGEDPEEDELEETLEEEALEEETEEESTVSQ